MEKELRILRNIYLAGNILFLLPGLAYEWLSKSAINENLRESLLDILGTPNGLIMIYYYFDLAGVNTAILILILVQSIKDFKKTKYTRALVVTIVLMAGSLLINLYARLQNSF